MKQCPICVDAPKGDYLHPCLTCSGTGHVETQNWYFTFGNGSREYVKINDTEDCARVRMFTRYGTKWSMQYDEARFLLRIIRYNLREIQ